MILLLMFLSAAEPRVDCSKIKWFVETYGQSEAMRMARKLGYSERTIQEAKKCLAKSG